MAKTKTRQLPLASYANGTYNFTNATPNGLASFLIEVGRCTTATPTIWPQAMTELDITVIPSFDGGTTFHPSAQFGFTGATGDIRINPNTGAEYTVQDLTGRFTPIEATAVKVIIVVRGGPIFSYLDVTVA